MALSFLGGFTDQVDPHARAEARRQERIRIAHRAGWPEIDRRHLTFGRFGTATDERDRTSYVINKGEIDADFSNIAAFFYTEAGDPIFLERSQGAQR